MNLKETELKDMDCIHKDQDMNHSYEHNNEISGSVNGGKFLDWLSVLSFRQKDCSMELVISLVVCSVLCKLLRIVVNTFAFRVLSCQSSYF
jgi:hypothetical protein